MSRPALDRLVAAKLRLVAEHLRHCAGQRLVVRIEEAARVLGRSPAVLERMAREGSVQLTWSAGRRAISVSELARLKRPRR